jgi:hypothetical protein
MPEGTGPMIGVSTRFSTKFPPWQQLVDKLGGYP